MKKKHFKKIGSKGSATLEILIAFTILILCMSSVILVIFGSQAVSVDSELSSEALSKAGKMLEEARFDSRKNYLSVITNATTETVGGLLYNKVLSVSDLTQCKKQTTSTVTWITSGRTQRVDLTTFLGDISGSIALGGDCSSESSGSWNNPKKFASDTINPGKSTAIDVLNRVAYLGADKDPFFYIADTHGATLGQTNGLFVAFSNGFTANNTIDSLDVVHNSVLNKNYVFAAMSSSTAQLIVIDVTDIHNPTIVATRRFSSCVAGSYPEGWRLYYYKNKLYLTTRYTAGPEFHIFDVTNPTNPSEFAIGSAVCKGLELGDTVNSMAVSDHVVGASTKTFVYFATDESNKELRVFDVTNPLAPTEVISANQDLPGAQNGFSVYTIGNKLYFGRQSAPAGPDLYVYDISNVPVLSLLGSQDIGTGVLQIHIASGYAFLSTPKSNQEFQVWNISSLSNITLVKTYNFGNIIDQGLDYESDWIYATGQSITNFQILYNQ